MAINGYFFNAVQSGGVYDRVYNAEDVTSYLNKIVGNGVFPNPSSQLQVRAGTGMQVIVNAGEGWINGHKMINTADMQLSVDSPDALLNRIDRVIFYADASTRSMGIAIKKGTNATNPTAPALVRNTTRYEMSLATIRVNKQITSIVQSMITDTRADSNVCGWVAGLIQQVDTSQLFVQWQTAYSDYYDLIHQQLDDFMASLTQELRVNTYVKGFVKHSIAGGTSSNIVPLSATDYTYEDTDIIVVYINGLLATWGTDYIVNKNLTPPSVVFDFPTGAGNEQEVTINIFKSIIGIEESI